MFFDDKVNTDGQSLNRYNCSSCHRSFYSSSFNIVNKCIFCNQSYINKENIIFEDDIYIIPFKKNTDYVIKDYVNKNNFFSPFSKKNISIKKLYIPIVCFDASAEGIITFVCADKNGNNTSKYLVDESIFVKYNSVLLPYTQFIPEKNIAMVLNYNINNMRNYSDELLGNGFLVDRDKNIDINKSVCSNVVKICRSNINHDLIKVNNYDNLNVDITNTKLVYVPIYLIINKYNGVNYYYIMNGENGISKMDNVYSYKKLFILGFIISIIIFVILFIIFR